MIRITEVYYVRSGGRGSVGWVLFLLSQEKSYSAATPPPLPWKALSLQPFGTHLHDNIRTSHYHRLHKISDKSLTKKQMI